jgi:hypothetical protein
MVLSAGAFLRVVTSPAVLAAGEIGESGPRRGDESMAFTQTSKKLYFNLTWASGVTTITKFIPCTPFRPSVTIGDRYGSLLEPLAALTGNSPNTSKRNNAVTAFFVPSQDNLMGNSTATLGVVIDFVAPTLNVTGNTNNVPLLPYLSVDGTSVLRNRGKDTIYGTLGQQRHFSIRIRKPFSTTNTLSGQLYVARQHSIEV